MVKSINTVPNPVLKKKAVECVPLKENKPKLSDILDPDVAEKSDKKEVWPAEIVELVTDLKDTARNLGDSCVGLASNQIWEKDTPPPAVFIVRFEIMQVDNTVRAFYEEFINPKIVTSGKSVVNDESCFSLPGKTTKKKREANVTIEYQTLRSKDTKKLKVFSKETFAAIAIQHEYDHLLGRLI